MSEKSTELLEIGLYAPIGLAALCVEKVLPVVRDEVQNLRQQVPAARFIGKMAGDQITQQVKARCDAQVGQLRDLRSMGLSVMTKLVGAPSPRQQGSESVTSPQTSVTTSTTTNEAVHTAVHLEAIEGYENLSAPQVLALLDGLTEAELAEVEAFEAAHRQRRTILNRISQLRAS
jgi:hypothetical protein